MHSSMLRSKLQRERKVVPWGCRWVSPFTISTILTRWPLGTDNSSQSHQWSLLFRKSSFCMTYAFSIILTQKTIEFVVMEINILYHLSVYTGNILHYASIFRYDLSVSEFGLHKSLLYLQLFSQKLLQDF